MQKTTVQEPKKKRESKKAEVSSTQIPGRNRISSLGVPRRILILTFVLILFPVIPFFYNSSNLKKAYRYDVKQNYEYPFQPRFNNILEIPIKSSSLSIPQEELHNKTAFLAVKIKHNPFTFPSEPYIWIKSPTRQFRQFFEYQANGLRYLNISNLADSATGNSKLTLINHNIQIPDQTAQLVMFTNPLLDNKKILVIAPHPDDAEIAAYGLYSNRLSYILTITLGEHGRDLYPENSSPKSTRYYLKAKMRFWNSITVPMLGAIPPSQCVNLGYYDATIREMYEHQDSGFSSHTLQINDTRVFRSLNLSTLTPITDGKANWSNLMNDLKSIISEIKPDIIVTPHPQLDMHPDHQYVTLAVLQSIKALDLHDISLFMYTNHLRQSGFYPFGPQGSILSLPPLDRKDLVFGSIYSHPISDYDRQNKILALDAHVDLRVNTYWNSTITHFKRSFKLLFFNHTTTTKSYYDRAIRSNELFFVLPDSLIDTLEKTYH